jgi:outer membrane beta-barrel protein
MSTSKNPLRMRWLFYLLPWISFQVYAGEAVVQNQLYSLGSTLEVTLTPALSTMDKYTTHLATSAGISYFFNDIVGIEAEGGYAIINGSRKLLDEILRTAGENLNGIQRLPLTDLKYMTWFASGGVVLSPLYGKLDFSSEFAVHIHLYFVAGAGVADYRYDELSGNALPSGGFNKKQVDVGVKPTFYFGGGLRFHLAQHWSLRFELRDQFYHDSGYMAQYKTTTNTIEQKSVDDFVHIALLRLGVCYAF